MSKRSQKPSDDYAWQVVGEGCPSSNPFGYASVVADDKYNVVRRRKRSEEEYILFGEWVSDGIEYSVKKRAEMAAEKLNARTGQEEKTMLTIYKCENSEWLAQGYTEEEFGDSGEADQAVALARVGAAHEVLLEKLGAIGVEFETIDIHLYHDWNGIVGSGRVDHTAGHLGWNEGDDITPEIVAIINEADDAGREAAAEKGAELDAEHLKLMAEIEKENDGDDE